MGPCGFDAPWDREEVQRARIPGRGSAGYPARAMKKLVTLGYLVRDQHLLLLRRIRPPNLDLWSPPGGKVEPFESPEDCIRREFLEETGLCPGAVELGGLLTQYAPGHYDVEMFLFRVLDASGELREGDGGPLEWVALDRLYHRPTPEADRRFAPAVLDPSCRFFRAKFVQTLEGRVLEEHWYERIGRT